MADAPPHYSGVHWEEELVTAERQALWASEGQWSLLVTVLVLLVISFLVANAIAFGVQVRREQRIQQKTQALAKLQGRLASPVAAIDGGEQTEGARSAVALLPPVPVTILTGFLGAGKTTLLNRILQTPSLPYKIMVLENEIGTISIDHALLMPGSTSEQLAREGIYVLPNGCMCCSARGAKGAGASELERILDYLLRIVNERGFDYLVVETTGLADPGPIIETFLRLRGSRFRLDAIVTMVDASAVQRFYDHHTDSFTLPIELQRQLLYADVVALNKMDLVKPTDLPRLQRAVASVSDATTVLQCVNAHLELSEIIGVNTFDAVRFRDMNTICSSSVEETSPAQHTAGVQTMHLDLVCDVNLAQFTQWLDTVTAEYARAHILRIKGVLAVAGCDERYLLQCVLDTYTLAPSTPWQPHEARRCRLVIIGMHLDKARLEKGFRQSCSDDPDDQTETEHEASEAEIKKNV